MLCGAVRVCHVFVSRCSTCRYIMFTIYYISIPRPLDVWVEIIIKFRSYFDVRFIIILLYSAGKRYQGDPDRYVQRHDRSDGGEPVRQRSTAAGPRHLLDKLPITSARSTR